MNGHDTSQALLHRLIGERAGDVRLELTADDDHDSFTVAAAGGRLEIAANTPIAIAGGLRHYLATACGRHIGDDAPVALPTRLPDMAATHVASPWRWRYHLNFCAFGYSAVYWDWARWETEIDRMALHGVNLPLCLLGSEVVWWRTLRAFGLDDDRARAHIGGPAFLPWAWMGCVHDHGTPVSDEWLEQRRVLAHRVLDRQRQLGMTPVLPGFTGYVPAELAGPTASRVDWMGFDNYAADPREEFFTEFGLALLREQEREYGSDGFYAIDPFIEGVPPRGDTAAVAEAASAIAGTLRAHHPDNVWVLQAWPFSYRADFWTPPRIEAFLDAIPRESCLVLDLWAEHEPTAESSRYFAGRDWLWCALHNLGGRPGMHGPLAHLGRQPAREAALPQATALRGIGTTAEFLGSDPVVYRLLADVAWYGEVPDIAAWIDDYAAARYERDDAALREAWRILLGEVYHDGRRSGPPQSIVASRPRVDGDLRPSQPVNLTEPVDSTPPEALWRAWDLLLDHALAHGASPGLRRDLVDVGDEVLSRQAACHHAAAVEAYRQRDAAAFSRTTTALLDCIADIDALCDTWPSRRLGPWLRRAWTWGRDDSERQRLETDARQLLTTWVAPGHVLEDYAGRHWSGLVSDYYAPRWRLWTRTLQEALDNDTKPRADQFDTLITRMENEWRQRIQPEPETAADVIEVAQRIRARHSRGS